MGTRPDEAIERGRQARSHRAAVALAAAGVVTLGLTAGCQSVSAGGFFARAKADAESRKVELNPGEALSTEDSRPVAQGLMDKWFRRPGLVPADVTTRFGKKAGEADVKAEEAEIATKFAEGEQLFQQGQLAEAERMFAWIVKKRQVAGKGAGSFFDAVVGKSVDKWDPLSRVEDPWGMKAQYYLAETRFQRGNYVGAHDAFEELLKTYPGTNYLDKAVKREDEIARIWLGESDAAKALPWHARLTGGLPFFDVGGNAVAALDHVRMNDPTGPLADDAALRVANYYREIGDNETAALYYDQLVRDHPKSPLLHGAMMASVDSKMDAYIGPEYDASGLKEAAETINQSMAMFPERRTSTADDLYHKLDLISDQEAERAYTTGKYYKRAGKVISAEYYFGMVAQKWPKSTWAEKARTELQGIAKLPRKQSAPSRIMIQPGAQDPFSMGGGGMQPGMGGMGGPGMLGPGIGR